jgi:hypothetical protein
MEPVKALLKKIRAIVEYFHKSPLGAALLGEILAATIHDHGLRAYSKLAQAIHQRWGSLVKCLVSFVERYDALKEAYHKRQKDWDLTFEDYKAVIELISILTPVKDIIVVAQSNEGAQLPFLVIMLTKLRMETLNISQPLTIIDPAHALRLKVERKAAPTIPPTPPTPPIPPREHENLTAIGQLTREGFTESMSKGNRFFHLNSKKGSCKAENGLGGTDIVVFFHPFLRKLKHIDAINSETFGYDSATDDSWIAPYKLRVKQTIIDLMVRVIAHNDARDAIPLIVDPQPAPAPDINGAKRQRYGEIVGDIKAGNRKRILAMKQAAYMDIDDEDEDVLPQVPVILSPLERALEEYDSYVNIKISLAMQVNLTTPAGLIKYWLTLGAKEYPVMAVVALAQLGTPPGSGVLENDFSSFANLVTRHRSSLDPAMVEMILFCKLNFSLIPSTIPVVATAAIDAKIPMRFRDPDLQENQQLVNDVPADIDSDLEEENNFEDDD